MSRRKSRARLRNKPPIHHDLTAPAGTLRGAVGGEATRVAYMGLASGRDSEARDVEVAAAQAAASRGPLWLDVTGLGTVATLESLRDGFGFAPLAMEDVVHLHQRPKSEVYEQHLFIVLRMPQLVEGQLELEQLSMFLAPNLVATFQERPGDCFEPIRERLRKGSERARQYGAPYVAYSLLDAVIDNIFPILNEYEQRLERIEERIFAQELRNTMGELLDLRRDFQRLRWALFPLRDVTRALQLDEKFMGPGVAPYLRDCHDHVLQAVELLENAREMLASLVELNVSMSSQNLNEVMKVLTIIATVFIPLSFVAGVYGMNFDTTASPWNMPELGWALGYPFALGLMAAIAFVLLFAFWRRGWLGKR